MISGDGYRIVKSDPLYGPAAQRLHRRQINDRLLREWVNDLIRRIRSKTKAEEKTDGQ